MLCMGFFTRWIRSINPTAERFHLSRRDADEEAATARCVWFLQPEVKLNQSKLGLKGCEIAGIKAHLILVTITKLKILKPDLFYLFFFLPAVRDTEPFPFSKTPWGAERDRVKGSGRRFPSEERTQARRVKGWLGPDLLRVIVQSGTSISCFFFLNKEFWL